MTKFMTIYAVHGDGGERGIGPIVGYYSSKTQAENHANHSGFYGGNGGTSTHTAVEIDGGVYVLKDPKPIDLDGKQSTRDAELRAVTIAALSPEQMRVLGLLS